MLAPAAQARQRIHTPLPVPDLDALREHAGLDPLADQPARDRVHVLVHVDRAAAVHPHRHPFARLQTPRRQRSQHGHFLSEARLPTRVLLREHLTQEPFVRRAAGKIAAATQEQRLVQGTLETVMTLFDVAVFVAVARMDGLAPQTVVLQKTPITLRKRLSLSPRRDGRRQAIGAMTKRHAAQFPQRVLQALAEALQALGEANRAGLPVRVGQHKVV